MNKYYLIVLSFIISTECFSSESHPASLFNACPADVSVSCAQDYGPLVTGYPVLETFYSAPQYWDEVISYGCPKIIRRHWTSASDSNEIFECDQTITLIDNAAPIITMAEQPIFSCTESIELPYTIQDCDSNISVEITWGAIGTENTCPPGTFRTQTQGGWGAAPNGGNPGTYLHAHFAEAFPNGLSIGCNNNLTLSTAQDITNFLPSGSTPSSLPDGSVLNPGVAYSNVLAGQLVAATLSITFDAYFSDFGSSDDWVGDLIIASGTFQGMNLSELIVIANEVIGGCNSTYSFSEVNEALTSFNENFVDGTENNNYLECGEVTGTCELNQSYTITATDQCGNSSTLSGTIQLMDNSAPEFVEPVTVVSIDCSEWPLDTIAVVDPCGISAVITSMIESAYSGPCLPVIERIYTATDACGNVSTFTQYIHLVDTLAPIANNIPPDVSLSCQAQNEYSAPTFTDNCDNDLEIIYSEQITGSDCNEVIVRTWTATDICGNSTSVSQTIIISDAIAPMFTYVPIDVTMVCGSVLPESSATATDNCSDAIITHTDEWVRVPGSCEILERTYLATDACGNLVEAIQHIYFTDDEAPILSQLPADVSGDCSLLTTPPVITATDNCTINLDVSFVETQNSSGCTTTKTRTWTATDGCGNSTSHTQILVLSDTTPPQFSAASTISLPCSQIATYTVPVTDNCGAITMTYSDLINGSGCTMQIIRTWMATDACSNSSQFVQTIQLTDTQSPVFTYVPQSFSISCGTVPPVQNAVATDNCTSGLIPVLTQTITGTGCAQIITRTWTVTDNCGNTSTASQTINTSDNVNPVFVGVPVNVNVACGQIPTVPNVTAIDNCAGNIPVIYSESMAGSNCDTYLIRMWTATDPCGNTITATQHIYTDDNAPPTWTNVPASITLNCNAAIPPLVNPLAVDNCSSVINTNFFQYSESVACGQILHRIWQATDGCGNNSSVSQTISFLDSTGPTFTNTPASQIEVTCNNIPAANNPDATDNCGSVSMSFHETTLTGGCPYTLRRVWTATDDCGNSSSFIQNILVSDNSSPILQNLPADTILFCGSALPSVMVTATDNCSGNIMVSTQEHTEISDCSQIIVRIFSATDFCGNTSEAMQTITIVDNTAPILLGTPTDVETECGLVPMPAIVTALDECQGPLDVQFSEEIMDLNTELICALDNAQSNVFDLALMLPGLSGISPIYVFTPNTATITINDDDGSAVISGELQNVNNADQRWIITMHLINKRNWSEWSALGRSYKDDMNVAENNFIDWYYYELSPTSVLTGSGLLAGSQLQITHAPTSYYYGFQLGVGANNRNTAYGLSGWFNFTGQVNGTSVAGHGDLYTENTCCPEQQIIRQWTATDCSGNTAVFTQQIHVAGENPNILFQPSANDMQMDVYYTSHDRFIVTIQTNESADIVIEYFTSSGELLGTEKRTLSEPNIPLKVEMKSQTLGNGIYFFRANNGRKSVTKRCVKLR